MAGFSVGFYFMVFYYAKNFALAYSLLQLAFLTAYYLIMPIVVLLTGFWLLRRSKYRRHWLFVGIIAFYGGFLLQILQGTFFGLWFFVTVAAGAVLSVWVNKYYKLLILLLFLMTLLNVKPLAGIAYRAVINTDQWKKLPDDIDNATFKKKPNIYYIQPDGYTSFKNLKSNKYYDFDNSDYELFLKRHGFTLYEDYRSNYNTTLLSNSATFSMKQHHAQRDVAKYAARGIIIGNNPVLRILRKNGYHTNLIIENPYLIINRPSSLYDHCNISRSEIPYFGDGLSADKDVFADLKARMKTAKGANFYFVEKFLPTHVTGREDKSKGAEEEARMHMQKLGQAKSWLVAVIDYIAKNDPDGLIIIGADHGGYAGFDHTQQSLSKTTDADLIHSMYGSQLAIKWNNPESAEYDGGLKSGVNLFRTVFSVLAENKDYLKRQEESGSYQDLASPAGVYRYIDDNGKVVFERYE